MGDPAEATTSARRRFSKDSDRHSVPTPGRDVAAEAGALEPRPGDAPSACPKSPCRSNHKGPNSHTACADAGPASAQPAPPGTTGAESALPPGEPPSGGDWPSSAQSAANTSASSTSAAAWLPAPGGEATAGAAAPASRPRGTKADALLSGSGARARAPGRWHFSNARPSREPACPPAGPTLAGAASAAAPKRAPATST